MPKTTTTYTRTTAAGETITTVEQAPNMTIHFAKAEIPVSAKGRADMRSAMREAAKAEVAAKVAAIKADDAK
jgi:hypothetical protein